MVPIMTMLTYCKTIYMVMQTKLIVAAAFSLQKSAYGFIDSRRGGRLGTSLGQLVPKDYKTWPTKVEFRRKLIPFHFATISLHLSCANV